LNDLIIQELFWKGDNKLTKIMNTKYDNKNNFDIYPSRLKVQKVFLDFNKHFNKTPIVPPIFNHFNFSFCYDHLLEMQLLNCFFHITRENKANLLSNLDLDFLNNSIYVEAIKAVETRAKNYYKKANFDKSL